MAKQIPVVPGERFGKLVVLRETERDEYGYRRLVLRCDCGRRTTVRYDVLRRENGTRSCGCLAKSPPVHVKHGSARRSARSPEYVAWSHMRRRCQDARHPEYPNYGARGISVCSRWQDFRSFLADVGIRPSDQHSLDRIDNDRGYEPDNVRWSTAAEQTRNYRRNHWIEADGERLVLQDWAIRLGTNATTIIGRLSRGWSDADAVTIPVGARRVAGVCEVP